MRLFLIDTNFYCYKAYYAIKNLSNSKGQPTNAVYGVVRMLLKLIKDEKPDYIAACFDLKERTFRHKRFEEYKAQRPPMPEGLVSQLPIIKEAILAYNIPIFELEGFEADDVIATLAGKAALRDIEVYVVTQDKDLFQLIDKSIKVWTPEGIIYDEDAVMEKFGVKPERVVDVIALTGDVSDNIPGVPGIGEKTALTLLKKFGSLESLISSIDDVPRKDIRENLGKYTDRLRQNKELITVDSNVPLEINWDELKFKPPDNKRLFKLFKELEFRTLLKELNMTESIPPETNIKTVSTKDELEELIRDLGQKNEFALSLNTENNNEPGKIVGIGICRDKGLAYYITSSNQLESDYILQRMKPIFEDKEIKKLGHDIKHDVVILFNEGIELKGIEFDTMVAGYLLNPSKGSYGLEDLVLEYMDKFVTGGEVRSNLILLLRDKLYKELKDKGMTDLFYNVEIPMIKVLAAMEINGVAIDVPFLNEMSAELDDKLKGITRDIYEIAGEEFNINSPKQLSHILFDKLNLPVIKRLKTGPSTDVEVLGRLSTQHALPHLLLEYRELSKLKSTYVDVLPLLVNPGTHRVHTTFNQAGTSTGRISSSKPNLQNIPIKTEIGRKIRRAFVPQDKGWRMMSSDYSQIDLRVLAHISGDENLINAFKNNLDIHRHTASLIFNMKEEDVPDAMRDMAKRVNFGIVYGMSPYGLSKDMGIDAGQAEEFITSYFQRYPGVKRYMESQIEKARSCGYVTTILERRRFIFDINSESPNIRQAAERVAINTPIQGSSADLLKLAMLEIDKYIREYNLKTKMVLQVHDELVFEAPEAEIDVVQEMVIEKMEGAARLKVPIKVEVKVGNNWAEI
ncbi:MAG: DNA polymerase I [Candidatus Omnitrophica bacterium]|nr:DNA polymerase I [Candidatus Omnitrophota bacterium]